jgi:vacuolar-type H+-ATPase subunit E/Vma4
MRATHCLRDRKFGCRGIFDTWLTLNSAGGAMIVGTNGRIDINNTFQERLKLLESQALPSIRVTLFGENENRKFHD